LKDHFGDEGLLVVGSDLDKFSPRWRIVEKSKNGMQISNDKVGGTILLKLYGGKM